MKKFLSVCLVILMMLSVFALPTSAITVDEMLPDESIDDVYYFFYDDVAFVIGFDFDESDTSPKPGIVIPETIAYEGSNYEVSGILGTAFENCDYVSVTLPSTISYIGDAAFAFSPYLEEVIIPIACHFEYFGDDVFLGTPFEAELYSKDETILGDNVLFSYIGNAEEYVIPENIEIIAPKCFFMSGAKSVVFNDKVTEILSFAFASCRNLTEINIPDSVETIGEGAFKDCTNLRKITLGKGVQEIGLDCFANTKIKSIHLGQRVYEISGAFRGCKTLETITIESSNTALLTDGNAVYFKTTFLFDGKERDGLILEYYIPSKAQGNITIKSNVGAIGEYAFYGCDGIENVVANELEFVDVGAFCNSSIKSFSAKGNYMICDYAFKNCNELETISLENAEYIGVGSFENCTSLETVTFSPSLDCISELAFSNTGLKNIVIAGNDCCIYESAFKDCKALETVKLEEGVYYLGTNAFLGCSELKTVYISKTVKDFEENALNGCDNVTFQVTESTEGHKIVEESGYDFEIVARLSFFERIAVFFENLFSILFGWII